MDMDSVGSANGTALSHLEVNSQRVYLTTPTWCQQRLVYPLIYYLGTGHEWNRLPPTWCITGTATGSVEGNRS